MARCRSKTVHWRDMMPPPFVFVVPGIDAEGPGDVLAVGSGAYPGM